MTSLSCEVFNLNKKFYELKKKKKKKSLAIISSSVSSTPLVIENSTPRNHHHFRKPSSPRLSGPGGWRPYIFPLLFTQAGSPTCLNTSFLLFAWLNSVF